MLRRSGFANVKIYRFLNNFYQRLLALVSRRCLLLPVAFGFDLKDDRMVH